MNRPSSSWLRPLRIGKALVWDYPIAMLPDSLRSSGLARMGIRCYWFLGVSVLWPVGRSLAQAVGAQAAVDALDTTLVVGGSGVAIGAASVFAAAAYRRKVGELIGYWRKTVGDGVSEWRGLR